MSTDVVTITIPTSTGDITLSGYDYNMSTVTVGSIDLSTSDTITLSDFSSASDFGLNMDWIEQQSVYDEYKEEKAIRERNEGVQKAYEQYKIMVALAKLPPEFPTDDVC